MFNEIERREILKALETIKGVCGGSAECRSCPLRGDGYYYNCMFDNPDLTPIDWNLNSELPTWRAFCD